MRTERTVAGIRVFPPTRRDLSIIVFLALVAGALIRGLAGAGVLPWATAGAIGFGLLSGAIGVEAGHTPRETAVSFLMGCVGGCLGALAGLLFLSLGLSR